MPPQKPTAAIDPSVLPTEILVDELRKRKDQAKGTLESVTRREEQLKRTAREARRELRAISSVRVNKKGAGRPLLPRCACGKFTLRALHKPENKAHVCTKGKSNVRRHPPA